ncbi:MAG: AMIN domain-containing protein, partial [Steroidobacter sp.]
MSLTHFKLENPKVKSIMKNSATMPMLWSLIIGIGTLISGMTEAATQLTQIDTNALPGDQVQLRLKLSDAAPQPLIFTVDNPARISMDLADTTIALPSRRIDVKRGVLDTVNVAEANGRTRVVLNLNTMVPYDTKVEGD